MRFKIFSLVCFIVLVYIGISLFIQDKSVVGIVGYSSAIFLIKYFGFLIWYSLFLLIFMLYKLNFSFIEDFNIKLSINIFLFLNLLILQALLVNNIYSGEIGKNIIKYTKDYIGLAGIYIFILIGISVSLFYLIDFEKLKSVFDIKRFFPKKNKPIAIKKTAPKPKKNITKKETTTAKLNNIDENEKKVIEEFEKKEQIIKNKIAVEFNNDELINEYSTDMLNKKIEENTTNDNSADNHTHIKIVDELEENKKLLQDLEIGKVEKPKDFRLPSVDFFQNPPKKKKKVDEAYIDKKIKDLLEKLAQFRIEGDVVRTYTGPIVTTFEFKPAPNVKVSKILNLQDDLAMALKAQTIRIQAPIPGKDVVGIEIPNEELETIYIKEILDSDIFQNSKSSLTMILGKDIVGKPFITDLKKLPHLLIAGTTGSGKSVGINGMIISLLYKNSPDRLKFIMIDPKMLEFSIYNDIPHLLTPVITKPTEAINALANMVKEMEKRYAMMAETKTKNIENYNEKAKKEGKDELPYIVVIIDELADLMMTSGKDVELSIARLAQMARASGIHLIVATQRPSVDVVTGLIKANLPSRISYKVGQRVDSKIILDSLGAESLLGRGDMLFTPPGISGLVRIHAPWSSEDEIEKVIEFLKEQREVEYDMNFVKDKDSITGDTVNDNSELDDMYEQAKTVILQDRKTSISYLQRRLKIGYNRAASLIEQLEQTGILSPPNSKGNREILV